MSKGEEMEGEEGGRAGADLDVERELSRGKGVHGRN
jgi:hypothetical protein